MLAQSDAEQTAMMADSRGNSPVLTVMIEVPPRLALVTAPDAAVGSAICTQVGAAVTAVMAALGVPGHALVRLAVRAGDGTGAGRVLSLFTDGREARYPNESVARVAGYVDERLLAQELTPAEVLNWLEQRTSAGGPSSLEDVVEFFSLLSVEIVKRQPAILLGPPQLTAYRALVHSAGLSLAGPGSAAVDDGWLTSVLEQVLDVAVAIDDHSTLANVIADGLVMNRPQATIVEDLIEALRSDAVVAEMPRPYLRELSTSWQHAGATACSALRELLFNELGVRLPPFRFAVDDGLKPGSFAFRVNHLTSTPVRGLGRDQYLIERGLAHRRAGDVRGARLVNLLTGETGVVVDGEPGDTDEQAATWNQFRYLMLCMADVMREQAWRIVHRDETHDQLRILQAAFPALVTAAYSIVPDDEITRTRRSLVRAAVSVRNLRGVVAALVERRLQGAEGVSRIRESALAAVRSSLAPEVALQVSGGTKVMPAFVLGAEADAAAVSVLWVAEHSDAILDALRSEMARLPRSAAIPPLVTLKAWRRRLEQLVAVEFPRMAVFSRDELPPDLELLPIARIHVDARASSRRRPTDAAPDRT